MVDLTGVVSRAVMTKVTNDNGGDSFSAELLADCEAVLLAAEGITGSSGVAGLLNPGVGSKGTQPKLLK